MLSRDVFIEQFVKALREAGETRPIRCELDTFCVVIGDDRKSPDVVMGVGDAYHHCEKLPADRQINEIHRLAKLYHQPRMPVDYQMVEKNLRLSVKPTEYLCLHDELAAAWGSGSKPGKLLHSRLTDDLMLCVGLLDGPALRLLTEDQIAVWGTRSDEIFRSAYKNQSESAFRLEKIGSVYRSPAGEPFAASHFVFGELLSDLPLRGSPVVLLPSRDCLVVTGSEDIEGLHQMAAIGHTELDEPGLLVSGRPMRLEGEAWIQFEPPAAVRASFAHLARAYQVAKYAEQSSILRLQYRNAADSTRIAELRLFPDGPAHRTVALWRSGAPTLLPVADEVALHDLTSDTLQMVRWENLQRVLRDRLVPVHLPLRYRAEHFPTLAEIGAMNPRAIEMPRPKLHVPPVGTLPFMKR